MDQFDIVITQAVLFEDDILLPLGADGGGFVNLIRSQNEKWPQWSVIEPKVADHIDGFEQGSLLRALAFAVKFECALCARVHNHQRASDLGLDDFWSDPEGTGIRLLERSYSLVATDFGQFVLVFCFRFDGGTPSERAEMLVRVCAHRAIRTNIGQRAFAKSAIRYAEEEVDRVIGTLCPEVPRTGGDAVADPTSHDSLGWILHPEDLTAFPWILAGELSPRVREVIAAEDFSADTDYHAPSRGNPCCIVGNNYGIYCETDELRPMRLEMMPLLVHKQATYYTTRQIQKKMVSEMRSAVGTDRGSELAAAQEFDRFSLYFNRYTLGHDHFNGAQLPRLKWFLAQSEWYLGLKDAHSHLDEAVTRHREYLHSRNDERVHRDARRQESILFVIAILQVFSIISIFADYRVLNPAAIGDPGDGGFQDWAPERWLLSASSWLPRLLALVVAGTWLWYASPAIGKWCRRLVPRKRQVDHGPVADKPDAPPIDSARFEIRSSPIHGQGLWATRQLEADERLFDLPGGERVSVSNDLDTSGEHWNHEWNATPGELHIRSGVGTPYRVINHSRNPNSKVEHDAEADTFSITTLRRILLGEEILIDYSKEPLEKIYIVERGGYL